MCVTHPLAVYKTARFSLILPTKTLVRTRYVQFTFHGKGLLTRRCSHYGFRSVLLEYSTRIEIYQPTSRARLVSTRIMRHIRIDTVLKSRIFCSVKRSVHIIRIVSVSNTEIFCSVKRHIIINCMRHGSLLHNMSVKTGSLLKQSYHFRNHFVAKQLREFLMSLT